MIREALAGYIATIGRTFEGRENTVGASEVGQCARKTYFTKNAGDRVYGAAPDEDYDETFGAALRGQLIENHFWLPALRAHFGDKLLYAGDQQRTLISGFLSATPDGLLVIDPPIVLECKSIDPRVRLDGPKPEHAYQAIVQIGLFRELTPHQPDRAIISYINASFLDDVVEFVVHFDPAIFEQAKRRAAQIATAQSPDELKPEGWIAGGRECEYCAFNVACGRVRHAVPSRPIADPPDPQFVAEIVDLAREAKGRRALLKRATADLREIEHNIKERLRAKNVRHVKDGDVSVIWSAVRGRPSYDMPAIREAAAKAGVDLAEFERTGEPSDRLTVRITDLGDLKSALQTKEVNHGRRY
jgi:hypothetical protein